MTLIEATNLQAAALTLFSYTAMLALPGWEKARKTPLPNALHFQRGIQNVRVLDVEVEIPLQSAQKEDVPQFKATLGDRQIPTNGSAGAKPDWNLVRRAWWDAVLACYRHADTCPQWMPLEMRITAGSEIVMASQRGNDLGTCSIEVLTLEAARDMWTPYAEEIVGLWTRDCTCMIPVTNLNVLLKDSEVVAPVGPVPPSHLPAISARLSNTCRPSVYSVYTTRFVYIVCMLQVSFSLCAVIQSPIVSSRLRKKPSFTGWGCRTNDPPNPAQSSFTRIITAFDLVN